MTSQQVIQLDAISYKHVKLQEKVSLRGAFLLKVTDKVILCSDPLQGVQVISLPNLTPVRQWKFPELKE